MFYVWLIMLLVIVGLFVLYAIVRSNTAGEHRRRDWTRFREMKSRRRRRIRDDSGDSASYGRVRSIQRAL